MKIELDKTKERDGKTYHLSLITEDWYFYSDYENNIPKSNTLAMRSEISIASSPFDPMPPLVVAR